MFTDGIHALFSTLLGCGTEGGGGEDGPDWAEGREKGSLLLSVNAKQSASWPARKLFSSSTLFPGACPEDEMVQSHRLWRCNRVSLDPTSKRGAVDSGSPYAGTQEVPGSLSSSSIYRISNGR